MRLHGAHPCGGRRHMLRVLPAWDVRVARGLRWACALLLPRRLRRQNNSIECYRRSMNSKKKTTARIRRCQSMLVKRQPTVQQCMRAVTPLTGDGERRAGAQIGVRSLKK